MSSSKLSLSLVWEIPLAVLSFCFFKIVKAVIGFFYGIYVSRDRTRATQWKILSADTLKIPIVLPVLMTKGPRWNTHAIIGTVGPFEVQQTLTIDLEAANRSAQSWTVVVYSYPGYATIAQINSIEHGQSQQYDLNLPSGQYSLGVRYYEWTGAVEFPTVAADGMPIIATQTAPADTNDFYERLSDRHSWFYGALHYYIYTLLKLRQWLPDTLVAREYLPVGNPDTTFLYDAVEVQQALSIQVKPSVLQTHDLYFSLYRRSSLPLFYTKIDQEKLTVPAFPYRGYYLIRIRPRCEEVAPLDPSLIQIRSA